MFEAPAYGMPQHLSRIKHPSSLRRCDLSHQTLIPKEVTVFTQVATLAGNGSECVGLTVSSNMCGLTQKASLADELTVKLRDVDHGQSWYPRRGSHLEREASWLW